MTATGFAGPITGAVTGNADTATLAATVTITDNEDTNENNAVVFLPGGDLDGGDLALESDGTFYYNPSTGTVTSTAFTLRVMFPVRRQPLQGRHRRQSPLLEP
ncbi:MAG: hypothetical protein ACYSW3_31050 [Planctomycetota bacterium]